ncbi:hypothetical protein FKM82_029371 [Ascaphus truei]
MSETLTFLAKVEINKKQKCPGHGCEKAPTAETAECGTAHCTPSIAGDPFSTPCGKKETESQVLGTSTIQAKLHSTLQCHNAAKMNKSST